MTRGQLRRLIINVPPRTSKSSIISVAWPAWTWAQNGGEMPLAGPQVQFLFSSYAQTLSLRDSVKTRRLIESPWYQDHWGDRFKLTGDQNTKIRFENDQGGYRLATSVSGSLTGEGGLILAIDDPHNAVEMESEAVRDSTIQWWDESFSTRLNDPKTGAYVVIMQRLHELDLTGHIISKNNQDWTHLCLPMRYDPLRHCKTRIGWTDPRREEGELLCPNRFGEPEVRDLEARLGPFASAGQLQQTPTPRGGGILKRAWWQLWDSPDGKFPACSYVVAAADTAYTEKEENDPTGFTVWGLFKDERGQTKAILMNAWRKRLELHGSDEWKSEETMEMRKERVRNCGGDLTQDPWRTYIETGWHKIHRWPKETEPQWNSRTQPSWGLCEWIAHSCRRFQVDSLLIEGKASGLSVAQELRRLYGNENWVVRITTPEGDKVARAYAVQSVFTQSLVYAPDRDWADMVILESENFPKGQFDDLTDSVTMALKFLRDSGMLIRKEEREAAELDRAKLRQPLTPLYPA